MAQANKAKAPEQLRKISVKTVYGEIDFEKLMEKKQIPIMDVYGIATRQQVVTSDYGDSLKFGGQFRAVNCDTGEVFRSSVLFLPKFLQDDLAGAMGAGTNAEFAVHITAKFDKDAATKYVYLADSLVEAQESDALKALEEKVNGARKLLAAPKKS